MSARPSARRLWTDPRFAIGVLALAAVVWGVVVIWQYRSSPVRHRIEAGMRYARLGEGGRAAREWQLALRLDPDNADAWHLLGEYYLSASQWPDAVVAFSQLLRLHPREPKIHARLAAASLGAGDEMAAYRYAEEELKRDPNDVGSLAIASTLLSFMGDDRGRVEYLRRLVRIRPEDPDFRMMLAEALTFQHFYDEARPLLERIMAAEPTNAAAYALRGVITLNEEPSPEGLGRAEADFRRSLRLNPVNPYARLNLGKLYKRLGQLDRARFQLEQAAALTPDKMDIFYELAETYHRTGNPRKAARAGARFALLRDEAERVNRLERRCAAYPEDFDLHRELALLSLKKRDFRRASHYLNRAQTLRPGDPAVRAALQQLAQLTGSEEQAVHSKALAALRREPGPATPP